jgi:hypothetical protein
LDARQVGITVNDVDWTIHKYKDNADGLGKRTVHLLMNIEVKAFGAMPSSQQRQTLFFQHQLLDHKRRALVDSMGGQASKRSVWHFGYYVLSIAGAAPGPDHDIVQWCRFDGQGDLIPRTIQVPQLVKVLRFEHRPDTLRPLKLRRHHKTRRIALVERVPLGFLVESVVTRRS